VSAHRFTASDHECGASPGWLNPSPLAIPADLLACVYGCAAGTSRTWPAASNSLPPSCSSSIPTARKFPTSATKTVRPNCPTHERSLRRNKPCPRCQPSPWKARARFHARLGSPGSRDRSCRPRRSRSGPLQPDNRLDVGWEVSRRFENLAVVPDQRFAISAQLAHVRSVHLVQDRV
jgi:hypothetical protein